VNGAGGALRPWHTSNTRVLDRLSITAPWCTMNPPNVFAWTLSPCAALSRRLPATSPARVMNRPVGAKPRGWDAERGSIDAVRGSKVKKRARSMMRNDLAGPFLMYENEPE
jgi:hypothetical protein